MQPGLRPRLQTRPSLLDLIRHRRSDSVSSTVSAPVLSRSHSLAGAASAAATAPTGSVPRPPRPRLGSHSVSLGALPSATSSPPHSPPAAPADPNPWSPPSLLLLPPPPPPVAAIELPLPISPLSTSSPSTPPLSPQQPPSPSLPSSSPSSSAAAADSSSSSCADTAPDPAPPSKMPPVRSVPRPQCRPPTLPRAVDAPAGCGQRPRRAPQHRGLTCIRCRKRTRPMARPSMAVSGPDRIECPLRATRLTHVQAKSTRFPG